MEVVQEVLPEGVPLREFISQENAGVILTPIGKHDYGRIQEEFIGIFKVCQVHW